MRILLCLLLLAPATNTHAEPANDDKTAVLAVVQRFFDAMQTVDAAGISATWLPHSQYSLGVSGNDGYKTKQNTVENLTTELVTGKVPWLERMWSPIVLVAGRTAVIWGRYDFHVGNKFTHNGTDCYTLLKTDAGWKIAGLVFTVEPGGTTENPAGPPH